MSTKFLMNLPYLEGEIEVCVDYDATCDPGKVSGPPEDCYPPYEEMIINSVTTKDGSDFNTTESDMEAIEQAAWDDYTAGQAATDEAEYYAELNRGYAQDRI